jgi:hypothetical protein
VHLEGTKEWITTLRLNLYMGTLLAYPDIKVPRREVLQEYGIRRPKPGPWQGSLSTVQLSISHETVEPYDNTRMSNRDHVHLGSDTSAIEQVNCRRSRMVYNTMGSPAEYLKAEGTEFSSFQYQVRHRLSIQPHLSTEVAILGFFNTT